MRCVRIRAAGHHVVVYGTTSTGEAVILYLSDDDCADLTDDLERAMTEAAPRRVQAMFEAQLRVELAEIRKTWAGEPERRDHLIAQARGRIHTAMREALDDLEHGRRGAMDAARADLLRAEAKDLDRSRGVLHASEAGGGGEAGE